MQVLSKAKLKKNSTVLLRTDFNVPMDKNQKIQDDTRIKRTIPTLEYLMQKQVKIIICSHLGRPDSVDTKHNLKPVAKHLESLLRKKVHFLPGKVTKEQMDQACKFDQSQIVMLDNLRFNPGEENDSISLAMKLSQCADIYINDAFSVSHRKHASVSAITKYLPSLAGFQFEQEYKILNGLIKKPERPLVTVVGGAKISTKIGAVSRLIRVSDIVLVGGGLANHFIKADGYDIARSYLEDKLVCEITQSNQAVNIAEDMIRQTRQERMFLNDYIPLPKILYPIDVVACSDMDKPKQNSVITFDRCQSVDQSLRFLDIGPKTAKLFTQIILQAGTVFWNGPMGMFEVEEFASGSSKIAHAIAKSTATSVIGGGDTISAINQFGLADRYDSILASGGAALDYISGKSLPGLKKLLDN